MVSPVPPQSGQAVTFTISPKILCILRRTFPLPEQLAQVFIPVPPLPLQSGQAFRRFMRTFLTVPSAISFNVRAMPICKSSPGAGPLLRGPPRPPPPKLPKPPPMSEKISPKCENMSSKEKPPELKPPLNPPLLRPS